MMHTAFEACHVGIIISLSPICPSRHLANWLQRLAICSGWLLKTYLSTVTKRNSKDKTFYLHFTQPLQIAAVTGWAVFSDRYI
jgi:hypothetical protein